VTTTGVVLLVTLGVVLVSGMGIVAYAITARGPEDTFPLALLRAVTLLFSRCVHRLRVEGTERDPLPPRGPVILVSNHRSGLDPVILSVVTLRRVRFLMAREYYAIPVLHSIFRALGCIPVNRDGNDLAATKAALRALRGGEVIGIFPQGGIREEGSSMEGKPGIALLAMRTAAPVFPFHVSGSPHFHSVFRSLLTPSRTVVRVGMPLHFESSADSKLSRDQLVAVTTEILNAVAALGAPAPNGGS